MSNLTELERLQAHLSNASHEFNQLDREYNNIAKRRYDALDRFEKLNSEYIFQKSLFDVPLKGGSDG